MANRKTKTALALKDIKHGVFMLVAARVASARRGHALKQAVALRQPNLVTLLVVYLDGGRTVPEASYVVLALVSVSYSRISLVDSKAPVTLKRRQGSSERDWRSALEAACTDLGVSATLLDGLECFTSAAPLIERPGIAPPSEREPRTKATRSPGLMRPLSPRLRYGKQTPAFDPHKPPAPSGDA
jgi:hypothetical protein